MSLIDVTECTHLSHCSFSYPRRRREELEQCDGPRHADVRHEGGDAPQRHEATHQVHGATDPRRQTGEKPEVEIMATLKLVYTQYPL